MRAQLRTYHSIPSLQAHQDPNAYKQLQDAPRLKSILKGATEDQEQPSTVEEIMHAAIPRTNPVNLIFVLSQYAPKISELHFFPPRDFFDLVMRSNLSSKSRATAFLWLMWWYLESDFTKEAAERNPFGPGQFGPADDPITAENPLKCPPFDLLTPEQEALENVDSPDEQAFGEIKRKERIAILASDMAPVVTGPKRTNKKREDMESISLTLSNLPQRSTRTPYSRCWQTTAPRLQAGTANPHHTVRRLSQIGS
jgi:Ino eighty subunit 1